MIWNARKLIFSVANEQLPLNGISKTFSVNQRLSTHTSLIECSLFVSSKIFLVFFPAVKSLFAFHHAAQFLQGSRPAVAGLWPLACI